LVLGKRSHKLIFLLKINFIRWSLSFRITESIRSPLCRQCISS